MKEQIESISHLELNKVAIHGEKLKIKNTSTEIKLSKNQKKLLLCLMKKINDKRVIIEIIWGKGECDSNEMNYHQLIYKTRKKLVSKGIPDDFIMTIPRYGLCLNMEFVHQDTNEQVWLNNSNFSDSGVTE